LIPEFSVELGNREQGTGNREQGTGNREEGFQYVPSSVQKSNRSPIYSIENLNPPLPNLSTNQKLTPHL
jgi:hypothetical protein